MFKLRLNARHCISCGICVDVCTPGALAMRRNSSRHIEGSVFSYLLLPNETPVETFETFPYLAFPERCDGCLACVVECPVESLDLRDENARNVVYQDEISNP
jgi:ferredoxin